MSLGLWRCRKHRPCRQKRDMWKTRSLSRGAQNTAHADKKRPQEKSSWLPKSLGPPFGPKMVPRWPREGPRWPQKGPQKGQDGPKMAQNGPKMAPRWPKIAPRKLQGGPKMGRAGPRMAPRWLNMAKCGEAPVTPHLGARSPDPGPGPGPVVWAKPLK